METWIILRSLGQAEGLLLLPSPGDSGGSPCLAGKNLQRNRNLPHKTSVYGLMVVPLCLWLCLFFSLCVILHSWPQLGRGVEGGLISSQSSLFAALRTSTLLLSSSYVLLQF